MAEQAQKLAFTQKVQNLANMTVYLQDKLAEAYDVQVSRGWDPGGADPIVNTDIEAAAITAAELNSYLSTFRTRFQQLMSGQTVVGVVNGRSVSNTIRSDI